MTGALAAVAVGAVSGVLAGMFGIGGGIITTPAIRLVLGYPSLIAVGTPLLAILPTTVSGGWSYARNGLADVRTGLVIGAWGIPAAVLGALATRLVGGTFVLVVTAALILYTAGDMLWHAFVSTRDRESRAPEEGEEPVLASAEDLAPEKDGPSAASAASAAPRASRFAAIGVTAGAYSGFLGLGGGFVLVPLLNRATGMPIKRAIGTSLVAIGVLSIPGIVTHYALGNIDVALGLALMVGAVPGALLGARITRAASDKAVRIAFAVMLLSVGAWLAVSELAGLLR